MGCCSSSTRSLPRYEHRMETETDDTRLGMRDFPSRSPPRVGVPAPASALGRDEDTSSETVPMYASDFEAKLPCDMVLTEDVMEKFFEQLEKEGKSRQTPDIRRISTILEDTERVFDMKSMKIQLDTQLSERSELNSEFDSEREMLERKESERKESDYESDVVKAPEFDSRLRKDSKSRGSSMSEKKSSLSRFKASLSGVTSGFSLKLWTARRESLSASMSRVREMMDWTRPRITADYINACPKLLLFDVDFVGPILKDFWRKKVTTQPKRSQILFVFGIFDRMAKEGYSHLDSLTQNDDCAKKHLQFLAELFGILDTLAKSRVEPLMEEASDESRMSDASMDNTPADDGDDDDDYVKWLHANAQVMALFEGHFGYTLKLAVRKSPATGSVEPSVLPSLATAPHSISSRPVLVDTDSMSVVPFQKRAATSAPTTPMPTTPEISEVVATSGRTLKLTPTVSSCEATEKVSWNFLYSYLRNLLKAMENFLASRFTIREQFCLDLALSGIGAALLRPRNLLQKRFQELNELRELLTSDSQSVKAAYRQLVSSNMASLGYLSRFLKLCYYPMSSKLFRYYRGVLLERRTQRRQTQLHKMYVDLCDLELNPMNEELPAECRRVIAKVHDKFCCSGSPPVFMAVASVPAKSELLPAVESLYEPLFLDDCLFRDLIAIFR